jgi:hypothetical protein
MSVTYSENAKQWPEGYSLLRQVTERLQGILGPSAESVSVQWDRAPDATGRLRYTLKLTDETGEVVTDAFAPDELKRTNHMRSRLLDLWGNLLQLRSDRQVRKLQQLVTDGE